jgi:hypothetical protein
LSPAWEKGYGCEGVRSRRREFPWASSNYATEEREMEPKRIEIHFKRRLELATKNTEKETLEFILRKLEDMEKVRDFQSLLLRCREMKQTVTTRLRQIQVEISALS